MNDILLDPILGSKDVRCQLIDTMNQLLLQLLSRRVIGSREWIGEHPVPQEEVDYATGPMNLRKCIAHFLAPRCEVDAPLDSQIVYSEQDLPS